MHLYNNIVTLRLTSGRSICVVHPDQRAGYVWAEVHVDQLCGHIVATLHSHGCYPGILLNPISKEKHQNL